MTYSIYLDVLIFIIKNLCRISVINFSFFGGIWSITQLLHWWRKLTILPLSLRRQMVCDSPIEIIPCVTIMYIWQQHLHKPQDNSYPPWKVAIFSLFALKNSSHDMWCRCWKSGRDSVIKTLFIQLYWMPRRSMVQELRSLFKLIMCWNDVKILWIFHTHSLSIETLFASPYIDISVDKSIFINAQPPDPGGLSIYTRIQFIHFLSGIYQRLYFIFYSF